MMTNKTQQQIDIVFKLLGCATILILGVTYFSEILMPFLFALIISLALLPSCQRLERIGFNRFFSIATVLILLSIIVLGLGMLLYWQFERFISDLPQLTIRSRSLINEWSKTIEESLSISIRDQLTNIQDNFSSLLQTGSGLLQNTFSTVSQVLTFFVMVPVYTFFILYSRDRLKKFIKHQTQHEKEKDYLQLVDQVKESVKSYLKGMTIIVLIIAVLNSTGLLILGIKYAILLGVVSALLTVIPYVGVFIGALIPILVAFLTKDSLLYPLAVIGLYALIQFLEGNLITPRILGTTVHLNPLVIILGLVFAGFVAGIVGMIIAVPMLAIVKIIFNHSRSMGGVAILLGEKN